MQTALGEVTITGLHTVKEAVRFYDPVNGQPENIAITKELKRSVRSGETKGRKCGRGRKLNKRRGRPKEYRKQKKRWLNQDSPLDSADTLMREEEVVKANLKAADEFMSDATSKLHDALSATAVKTQTVNVATMMLDTA